MWPTMHTPINDISSAIIGAAIEVHRDVGTRLTGIRLRTVFGARTVSTTNPFRTAKTATARLQRHTAGLQLSTGFSCGRLGRCGDQSHRGPASHPPSSIALLSQAWRMEAGAGDQFSCSAIA